MAVRALSRRLARLEKAGRPSSSPFAIWYGSFDNFVTAAIWPGIRSGALDEGEMYDIIEALRSWEQDGTWQRAGAG